AELVDVAPLDQVRVLLKLLVNQPERLGFRLSLDQNRAGTALGGNGDGIRLALCLGTPLVGPLLRLRHEEGGTLRLLLRNLLALDGVGELRRERDIADQEVGEQEALTLVLFPQ